MLLQLVGFVVVLVNVNAIYPYFDTQDFIYNVPKVFRLSITLDKLLDYYEKKPSKDPEWYIALGIARGQLEYTINELDKSVPKKLKENLTNITRKMDRVRSNMDLNKLVYRSKEYEYEIIFIVEILQEILIEHAANTKANTIETSSLSQVISMYPPFAMLSDLLCLIVAKAVIGNIDVLSGILEPLTLGTMGTQKPYRFDFEQYVKEARNKMPTRKSADACTMQLLISSMEKQSDEESACELTPECSSQFMQGSAYAFQQTSRVNLGILSRIFDCMEGIDLAAHIYKLCMHVYKEAKSLETWNHPEGSRTLFMQQIFYCASQGYGEFIKPRWLNKIIFWQEPKGCYADNRRPFERLTSFVDAASAPTDKEKEGESPVQKAVDFEGGTCNSLTSAMAMGCLTIYVRALLESDQAFQYDVLD